VVQNPQSYTTEAMLTVSINQLPQQQVWGAPRFKLRLSATLLLLFYHYYYSIITPN